MLSRSFLSGMFIRSIIILALNLKWVTIKDLNDILYVTLCTKNCIYIIIVKDRYYFIIVEEQVLINIYNNVILTVVMYK